MQRDEMQCRHGFINQHGIEATEKMQVRCSRSEVQVSWDRLENKEKGTIGESRRCRRASRASRAGAGAIKSEHETEERVGSRMAGVAGRVPRVEQHAQRRARCSVGGDDEDERKKTVPGTGLDCGLSGETGSALGCADEVGGGRWEVGGIGGGGGSRLTNVGRAAAYDGARERFERAWEAFGNGSRRRMGS